MKVRGGDQHWELLPAQAALSMKVGSIVQVSKYEEVIATLFLKQYSCVGLSELPNVPAMAWEEQYHVKEQKAYSGTMCVLSKYHMKCLTMMC